MSGRLIRLKGAPAKSRNGQRRVGALVNHEHPADHFISRNLIVMKERHSEGTETDLTMPMGVSCL